MIKMTTMRIWISVSIAWPLFWILVFDRWFLLSPIGLLIAFGMPLAGWLIWFKFYRGDEEKMLHDARIVADKNAEVLQKLKKRMVKQR